MENAIYHGIKESGRNGNISVMVWKDADTVYLAVQDDGVGIRPEKLAELRDALKNCTTLEQQVRATSESYGLVNVNQRIVMSYGAQYGVWLVSMPDEGTCVLIRHPIIWPPDAQ